MNDETIYPEGPVEETDTPVTSAEEDAEAEGSVPDDAFIMPDQPIRHSARGVPDEAFISPDEPIIRSEPDPDKVEVTGIGGRSKKKPVAARKLAAGSREWNIRHAADLLDHLAVELREHGLDALHVHPDIEPLDAMLRGLIAGFLVGRGEME